ncbi:response regulator transcription factor [Bifidobacterium avesanii]|uniref:Response regulator n=1 Tax=Bifidobacterium avesanii TaxID=1798157 RepID=A0A7K3TGN6_9BIFI|nr:response regulator transcription factor [Bifidobacterium avesanii]KAB8295427.1 DNA-binding response regulator [Bifidobacterium avesanii]NEG77433.1 response regulator [Bifidobacterium avesanii]
MSTQSAFPSGRTSTKANATGKRTVGIVDNDPFTLSALRDVVERMLGYRVCWAERSAITALGLCGDPATAPDVLLTDVMMPDMSGLTLCRLVRSRTADIPVLAITSYNLDVYAAKARDAGAQGIVNKDDPAVITAAISAVANGMTWPYRGGGGSDGGRAWTTVTFPTATQAHARVSVSDAQRAIASLTARELEVVRLTCETLAPFGDIAVRLDCAESTVKTLARRAYRKLGVTSRRELMALWAEGLLS